MNRKFWFSLLAVAAAACLPIATQAQIKPDRPARTTTDPEYKWQVYAGPSYTSINQVNQSRKGLVGAEVSGQRNFGKYLGLVADGAFYQTSVGPGNPGSPTVTEILAGPELHFVLFERWNLFGRALLGGAHTGGEHMRPDIAVAGGGGAGAEYQMTPRWSIRLSGDSITAAFTLTGANNQNALSSHSTRNSRASLGLAYRF